MKRIGMAAVAVMFVVPAAAQGGDPVVERQYSRTHKDCMATDDAAAGVMPAMIGCIGEETARQDARLNQAYRMVMQRLPTPRQTVLRGSERLWIQRRDATCDQQASAERGGQDERLLYADCALIETVKRRLVLEHYR